MAAVETTLKAISTANGYETDIGASLKEVWRTRPYQEGEGLAITLKDVDCTTTPKTSGIHDHKLKVEVEIAKDSTTPTDARKWIQDVIKASGADRTWGGHAFNTLPGEDHILVDHEAKKLVVAQVIFYIEYRTKSFLPDQGA